MGLDYAVPLLAKTDKDTVHKDYILLFSCATSRAIYLKLTPDMLVHSILRAFKRFLPRRALMNSQPTFPFLTYLNLMNYGHIIKSM